MHSMVMRRLAGPVGSFWIALLSLAWFAAAQAQGYPAKPIRIIAPYAPGLPADILTRGLIEPLGRALGQPIVVENRVGADGIIGSEICAKAAPDGYTLCSSSSGYITFNAVLRANLPYEPLRDYAWITMTGFFDSGLIVFPLFPAKSVQELIDQARAKPDAVTWATFGVGSAGYMYMEWLKRSRGAPFYHVPFKTQQQAVQAVMTGEAQLSVNSLTSVANLVRAGKLKLLAVTSARRADFAPSVPTFEELGIKLPLRSWFGYHAPAGIPREIVQRLNIEINRIQADPVYKANVIDGQSIEPVVTTPQEFEAFVRKNRKDLADLVAFIGLKPE
jgi:tripartite-type tricarboxylate transporter receptor subunit TctC